MKKGPIERDLRKALLPILKKHSFTPGQGLAFFRDHADRKDRIGFSVQQSSVGGTQYSYGAGVVFPELNALLVGGKQSQERPTVGAPMHLLRPTKTYFLWPLSLPVDSDQVGETVELDLNSYALPFLESHSTLDAIKQSLERSDWRERFPLDRAARLELLVGIDLLRSGVESALQLLAGSAEPLVAGGLMSRADVERMRARLEGYSGHER